MKTKFNREKIITKCKEHHACHDEYERLLNVKTDKEFAGVLLKHLYWLKTTRVLKYVNIKELRKYVKDNNEYIYNWCRYIKDEQELWSRLTSDEFRYQYCVNIKDRKEIWQEIEDDSIIFLYCDNIKDRRQLWMKLTDQLYIYYYCRYVRDRPVLWQMLTDPNVIHNYCWNVFNRKELWARIKKNNVKKEQTNE